MSAIGDIEGMFDKFGEGNNDEKTKNYMHGFFEKH